MCKKLKEIEVYKIALRQAKKVLRNNYFKGAKINFSQLAKYTLAIAEVESGLYTCADNKNSTATGLMQILTGTRSAFEKLLKLPQTSQKALLNENYNVFIGIAVLAYQVKRYGNNWNKGVIAYNQGNAQTQIALERGKPYLAKVTSAFKSNDYAMLDSQAGSDLALNESNESSYYQEFP